MGHGIKWNGANKTYGPPPGVTEDQCHTLHVFFNGACIVSCWELTDEEIADIVRTRRVFQSVWSAGQLPPTLVGSESVVHATVADFGAVWRLNAEPSKKVSDGCKICDNELPQIPISLVQTCDRPGCPFKRDPT